ncbi:carbonic anhydrase [Streptomyces klenkii]|uniref:carbonic anhydrase n=1 Tax=Streptomyces klenkii TaxID=1420899 RepID=UPI003438DB3C
MQPLIEHARSLRLRIDRDGRRAEFGALAAGQSPMALFVTCSDSRVIPSLITGARPGDLFELRTAGNAVPAYSHVRPGGDAATIEYAVDVLRVPDIIVCGHSHCGAVGARTRGDDLSALPAVDHWLTTQLPGDAGHESPDAAARPGTADPGMHAAGQRNVRAQLERLHTYPCVRRRLGEGTLRLHGWFYGVDSGLVLSLDHELGAFVPL